MEREVDGLAREMLRHLRRHVELQLVTTDRNVILLDRAEVSFFGLHLEDTGGQVMANLFYGDSFIAAENIHAMPGTQKQNFPLRSSSKVC